MPISPRASLIILTYNNLDFTQKCLQSVFAHTLYPDFEVVLVDNASNDGTRSYLQEFAGEHPNVRLVLNQVNYGFAAGNNLGARASSGGILVFMNNDILVTHGWLGSLLRHLDDPQVGMVGPVTNSSGNESRIAVEYQDLEDMPAFAARYTQTHAGHTFEIAMLPFQCVALRREVWDEIGPLDERFGIGMFEDDDYALRLKNQGYKILCAEDVFVHHFGSASFSRLDYKAYWQLFSGNLAKFEEKWGLQWTPHLPRPEFLPQQLRQMLDASIWFTGLIADRDREIQRLEGEKERLTVEKERLNADVSYLKTDVNRLNYELQNIFNSNIWHLMQSILKVRRTLIPEGSRRERVFKQSLKTARNFNREQVKATLSAIGGLFRPRQAVPQARQAQPATPVQPVLVSAEYSWLAEHAPEPLVSVILPVYNHADMLAGAAHSVLHNTYANLELIILDDGSSDQIEPVLTRLRHDPRVRVYRQPNQKLPRALTHAHQFARGQFITWTSADNLVGPAAYQQMVSALLAHPEAVLVYADIHLIDEKNQPLNDETHRPQNQDPKHPDRLFLYQDARPLGYEADNYISACIMYRKEAAEALEGCYADDLRGLEDYDFWLRLQKSGEFYHLQNIEPFYFYRVHTRTMSHEILSQDSEREAHINRVQKLIDYESARRRYAQQRWVFSYENSLPAKARQEISMQAAQLPVDLHPEALGWSPEHKHLRFYSDQISTASDPLYVRVCPQTWELNWYSSHSNDLRQLSVWKGVEISPLALKAREFRANNWEFPQAGDRPVIGFHYSLADIPIDLRRTREYIQNNPNVFFVFADVASYDQNGMGAKLVQGLENAAYLGSRPFGEAYQLYACFQALWLPPSQAYDNLLPYRVLLALAYTIGRPFLAPAGLSFEPAPYQYFYHLPDESLAFIQTFQHTEIDSSLLNHYLESWSPAGRLRYLTHLADTIAQEKFAPRPDFEIEPPPEIMPQAWTPGIHTLQRPFKCGIVVDSLDKGGLEELVAQMIRHLRALQVEVFLLCYLRGGATAERIQAEGTPVYVAGGDKNTARDILARETPDLVHSHLAHLEVLEAADELGIPILETIHSSYLWYDAQDWEREKRRSRYFTRAAATSQTTRRFYNKHNPGFLLDWITVVGNGIDPRRIQPIDQSIARQKLGLPADDFIFISVAAYDGHKNQIGLLGAFERVYKYKPNVRLLCVGHKSNPDYYQKISEHLSQLRSKEHIELLEYRHDISELLSAADAFVIDSFSEGWSLAATEAMLAGLPVIHSDCGSAVELVGTHGERGIIVPNPVCAPIDLNRDVMVQMMFRPNQHNTESLIQAMLKMIADRQVWAEKRAEIRAFTAQTFSIENLIDGYLEIFEQASQLKFSTTFIEPDNIVETQAGLAFSPQSQYQVNENYDAEINFWDKELSLKGDYSEDILDRSTPERMIHIFPAYILPTVEELTQKNSQPPKVLDAGSGPLSMFAYGAHQGIIELVAADPLADHYRELLEKYHYQLEYPLVQAFGEQLSTVFGEATFDIAWIHNALDHSQSPEVVLQEMAKVLKPGGYLYFQGWSKEGTAEGWGGLHQHDIYLASDKRLMCASKLPGQDGSELFTRCISDGLSLELIEASQPTSEIKKWIKLVWRKSD